MRTESRHASSVKKIEPLAKSGFTAARPFGPALKAERGRERPVVTAHDRRLAQRVMLRVRASIHVALHGKPATFAATTLSVNSGGALVMMERSLPPDTRVVLENAQTRERVACRVTTGSREMLEGYQVPIEFDSPAPNFWRITFPPSDWRPLE